MPELPEVQAHAERLTADYGGTRLARFTPLAFHALKTATPAPDGALGVALDEVGRRGKYLLLGFGDLTFVVHLMQGGRLKPDPKQATRPKIGLARWTFDDDRALILTEAGKERRAGVWCSETAGASTAPPLDDLGPEAMEVDARGAGGAVRGQAQRLHGFLRHQGCIAGLGRRLANEVCHRAKLSPFASTAKLGARGSPAGGGGHPRVRRGGPRL